MWNAATTAADKLIVRDEDHDDRDPHVLEMAQVGGTFNLALLV